MNPLLIALAGMAAKGIGGLIQSKQPYEDVLGQWLKGYNGNLGAPSWNRDLNWDKSNALYQQLTNGGLNPLAYLGRGDSLSEQARVITDALTRGDWSPGTMQKTFLANLPGLTAGAGTVADAATSAAGTSMRDLARAVSARSLNNMQNALGAGGMFGAAAGPVAASLSAGAQEPLMQAETAINQLRSNAFNSAYNPMASFTMQNIANEPSLRAGFADLYSRLGAQQYSAANPLLSMLGGLSEQALVAPNLQQRQSWLASLLGGFGNTAAGVGSYGLGNMMSQPGFDFSSLFR